MQTSIFTTIPNLIPTTLIEKIHTTIPKVLTTIITPIPTTIFSITPTTILTKPSTIINLIPTTIPIKKSNCTYGTLNGICVFLNLTNEEIYSKLKEDIVSTFPLNGTSVIISGPFGYNFQVTNTENEINSLHLKKIILL